MVENEDLHDEEKIEEDLDLEEAEDIVDGSGDAEEEEEKENTPRPRREERRRSPPGGGRRRFGRQAPKSCSFCGESIKRIDYKESAVLKRFLTERGKIRPRRQTGTCAKHQRALATAIKRARHLALLPFTDQHIRGG